MIIPSSGRQPHEPVYADFEQPKGHDLKWIRTKAVAMYYSIREKNLLPVDLAIYAEYKLPRKGYKDYEELEIKLIMEKDFGSHQLVLEKDKWRRCYRGC